MSGTAESQGPAYAVGDSDRRPWGVYMVTGVGVNTAGEEYCEKEITVEPGRILSLQSHELRRELWTVTAGELTVLLDGVVSVLRAGNSIAIPLKGIHCMANLSPAPCVVKELQEGVCRESDITRYIDAYGRGTESPEGTAAAQSVAAYQDLLGKITAAQS